VVLGDLAVQAALVELEDLVESAVQAALVVPEDPVELAVQVALVVPESPAVLVALAVRAVREVLVVSENPAVPVALERELVQVEAELVRDRPRVQLAAALRTKSVIAAHPHDLVPLLAAEEDLAAAVAETTRARAAAEAVQAWAVADTVAEEEAAAVTEPAAVAEVAAAAVVDVVAVEDAEDKATVDEEKTNEIKNRYYDFAENFSGRFCDPCFLFVRHRGAGGAFGQNRCACDIAAKPKRIRLTKAGSGGSYSGCDDLRCRRRKGNSGAGQRGSHCVRGPRSRQESGGRVCSQGKGKDLG
jgi:hypothetical protein